MEGATKRTEAAQPTGLKFEESADGLRIEWDNRRVRQDRFTFWFMVLFWLIWCPATLFMTGVLLVADFDDGVAPVVFLVVWLLGGWGGTIGIPLALLDRRSVEWIEIGPEGIGIGKRSSLRKNLRRLAWDQIDEVALGRYNDGSDHESMVTVNVFLKQGRFGQRSRLIPGYWLANELKEAVYGRMRLFIEAGRLPAKVRIMENQK